MNAAGNKRMPELFPIQAYIKDIRDNIGSEILVNIIVNGKAVREIRGNIDYVTNSFFGVRISKCEGSAFVESFLFSEVFIGHVKYYIGDDIPDETIIVEETEIV